MIERIKFERGAFLFLVLVGAGCGLATGITDLPADLNESDSFKVRRMTAGRAAHTATLLGDGRVLIVGGFREGGASLSSVELFDPKTGLVSATGSLRAPRAGHTATLLPNGKVLISGGFNGDYLDTSEIYDPVAGSFTPGEKLTKPRSEHTATKLPDGTVLLAGGVGTGWTFLADSEVYDPSTGKFVPAGNMSTPRESHTATLLKDGKVLITGGHKDRRTAMTVYSSTEIYDAKTRTFSAGPSMLLKRHKHDAVSLENGKVLIVGGSDERDSRGAYTSIEMYDPKRAKFTSVGNLQVSRYKLNGTALQLKNGKVLIVGGSNRAELFDPENGTSKLLTGTFETARLFATATQLKDGRVMVGGGYDASQNVSANIWIIDPTE